MSEQFPERVPIDTINTQPSMESNEGTTASWDPFGPVDNASILDDIARGNKPNEMPPDVTPNEIFFIHNETNS